MTLRFEWDEIKASINLEKHGVDFSEASTVFADTRSITIWYESHSDQEDRYVDIGISVFGRLIVVVYTEREERISIISSRPATSKERAAYERQDT